MQGMLANTIQQANTQQTAEINNLRQEFEAKMHFSANIMTQLTNKLIQLDAQVQETRIRGWMDQAGPLRY